MSKEVKVNKNMIITLRTCYCIVQFFCPCKCLGPYPLNIADLWSGMLGTCFGKLSAIAEIQLSGNETNLIASWWMPVSAHFPSRYFSPLVNYLVDHPWFYLLKERCHYSYCFLLWPDSVYMIAWNPSKNLCLLRWTEKFIPQ